MIWKDAFKKKKSAQEEGGCEAEEEQVLNGKGQNLEAERERGEWRG